ncbi:MAG: hypothetical protein L0312_31175 [Acidobacteria bacterium]|nr:hypothetical protein [Acidobacteriota bacterium]
MAKISPRAFFQVESQLDLAVGFVRSVAGEAGVGENRADVAVELDALACPVAAFGQLAEEQRDEQPNVQPFRG